jgi:enoyl-[acyl-carrier protein] reductase III
LDAEAVAVDLERPPEVDGFFDRIKLSTPRLDVLVLSAAATALKPVAEVKQHHFERTFAITVAATFQCIRRALPMMGTGASIVIISGIDTMRFFPGHAVLAAAKSAAETLVRYLAVVLGPRGIRANTVVPGMVDTDSARSYAVGAFGSFDAFSERWHGRSAVASTTTADEIAGVVAFLCGREARSITGQSIVADGGYSLS